MSEASETVRTETGNAGTENKAAVEIDAATVLAISIENRHNLTRGMIEELRQLNVTLPLDWETRDRINSAVEDAVQLDTALFYLAEIVNPPGEEDFVGRVWNLDVWPLAETEGRDAEGSNEIDALSRGGASGD